MLWYQVKRSLAPSKKSVAPSLKETAAVQSGYLATNIPHTGHLSLAEGAGDAGGAASAVVNTDIEQKIITIAGLKIFIGQPVTRLVSEPAGSGSVFLHHVTATALMSLVLIVLSLFIKFF